MGVGWWGGGGAVEEGAVQGTRWAGQRRMHEKCRVAWRRRRHAQAQAACWRLGTRPRVARAQRALRRPRRTLPMHSLRRNSRDCQAKGSSLVVPSRRACRRRQDRGSQRGWPAGGGGWAARGRHRPGPPDQAAARECWSGARGPAGPAGRQRGGTGAAPSPCRPLLPRPALTSLGATTEDSVSRFSAAPGLPAPAEMMTVSPLGTSFTTPRIHPVAMVDR